MVCPFAIRLVADASKPLRSANQHGTDRPFEHARQGIQAEKSEEVQIALFEK
jgi:hypothetical protein